MFSFDLFVWWDCLIKWVIVFDVVAARRFLEEVHPLMCHIAVTEEQGYNPILFSFMEDDILQSDVTKGATYI